MNGLHLGLGFVVIDGEHPAAEVVDALGLTATFEREIARREALAETLHEGDDVGPNETHFAVFSAHGKTFVTRPGFEVALCESRFERALSARYGVAHLFQSHFAAPVLRRCEKGVVVAEVDAYAVTPSSGVLGVTDPLGDENEDVIDVVMAGHVGHSLEEIAPRTHGHATLWRLIGS